MRAWRTISGQIDTRRVTALLKGDRNTLEALLSEDLTYGHTDGQIDTKQKLLGALEQSHATYRNYEGSPPKVRVQGDTALINGSAELQTTAQNKPVAISIRYLAVYQKRGADWQLVAYQSTRLP
jgi:ketosteroid isomerase-like protein